MTNEANLTFHFTGLPRAPLLHTNRTQWQAGTSIRKNTPDTLFQITLLSNLISDKEVLKLQILAAFPFSLSYRYVHTSSVPIFRK